MAGGLGGGGGTAVLKYIGALETLEVVIRIEYSLFSMFII